MPAYFPAQEDELDALYVNMLHVTCQRGSTKAPPHCLYHTLSLTGIKYDTDITGQTGNETKMFSLHFFR